MAAGDRDWGIIGVSLRSGDVAAQLGPQDGLYTVSTRSAVGTQLRLIGAVRQVLVAAGDGQAVIDAIAAPTTHIVSFTVTEKRTEEHTSELPSLMRISYAGFCLNKTHNNTQHTIHTKRIDNANQ